jgi:NAD+ kinase
MILADPRNPTALAFQDELLAAMPEGWDDPEVVLVLGGDGFLLHSVADHGFHRTYLGLNAGRVGFLLNDVSCWDVTVDQLRRRAFTPYAFPILEARATDGAGQVHTLRALNDVVLDRATGQTAHLRLLIDEREVVDPLVADGLIFSTALGSTAYTVSAGGPACHPELQVLAVTAICPHKPRLMPFLLPLGAHARVEVRAAHRRPVRLSADGNQIDDVRGLEVTTAAERVRIAWLEGHDHTQRMVTKILRP